MLQDAEEEFCTRPVDIPRADRSRGLENYSARVIGAEWMVGGRDGGRRAEARGSDQSCSLSRPLTPSVSTSYQICALLRNPAAQIWARLAIYVILARTHNREFVLVYGLMSAAE